MESIKEIEEKLVKIDEKISILENESQNLKGKLEVIELPLITDFLKSAVGKWYKIYPGKFIKLHSVQLETSKIKTEEEQIHVFSNCENFTYGKIIITRDYQEIKLFYKWFFGDNIVELPEINFEKDTLAKLFSI